MLVKCIETKFKSIKDTAIQEHLNKYSTMGEIDLSIGLHYQVFGIFFRDGIPWYLICEEADDEYPRPNCSVFFELVDGSVSPGWSFSLNDSNVGKVSLLPDEWAADPSFLEKLVDEDAAAISRFNDIKVTEEKHTHRLK